jgi:IPT/TIG domain-containing protein
MRWRALVLALAVGACSKALVEDQPDAGPATPSPDGPVFADAAVLSPVSVDYADPDHGPFVGATQVTLRGRGFADDMTITIGGKLVEKADLEVVDSHRAVIKTPAGAPGEADIRVVVGANEATRAGGFLYEPIYAEPNSGSASGGTYITIRGLGTRFSATDVVTLDGKPLNGVQIVNGQALTGLTPDGIAGTADLKIVSTDGTTLFAEAAFTYQTTVDGFNGGFGGGPITDSVNVTVVDAYTGDGVPLATVVVGDPATSTLWGLTDPFGSIVFSQPGLRGPLIVTAGHKKYESGAMAGFDASNVSMFLTPLPPDPTEQIPPSGPFPPGRSPGTVSGTVSFGGSTSIGTSDNWSLVPDPPPGSAAVKRTYVFTTAPNIFGVSNDPGPGGTIDWVPGQSSWHFQIPVRPAAFALVAIAGLYEDIDPDGSGPLPRGVFTPYAMGVLRDVLVGPGESLEDISVNINIPLDTGMKVELTDAPDVTARGPDEYHVNALIDLGGEGVIRLPGSRAVFRDKKSAILTGLAPLVLSISDASYSIVAGAYTSTTQYPYSVRVVRGVQDLSKPVKINDFLGSPRFLDPPPNGATTARHLVVGLDGGSGVPTLWYHRLTKKDGTPVWRVVARGTWNEVPLYDLTTLGLPPMTTDQLLWTSYSATLPGGNFDTFNYGKLNTNLWSAYTYAATTVAYQVP